MAGRPACSRSRSRGGCSRSRAGRRGRSAAASSASAERAVLDARAYRDRFPILAETTYLINHSLGAMPAAAEERLAEYARTWRTRGIRAWAEGWWTMPMTVGDQVGRIVGAPAGTTVMHQNVAVAEAIVLSCFRPVGARNRVVYERGNFPSVRYLYQAQPEPRGRRLRLGRGGRGRDRRAHAARPDQPRPVQDRRDPGRRGDRRRGARRPAPTSSSTRTSRRASSRST